MPQLPKPYEDFATLAEQDAYIRRQLAFFRQIPHTSGDDAGWLALKLSCSHRQATRLIAQMRARQQPPA
jgi:hypothetical protein